LATVYPFNAPPIKGQVFSFEVSLVDQSDANTFKANPTLAAGDVTVSKDGGDFANIGTLPTAIQSGKVLTVTLSADEMNANRIAILFSDVAGAQWQDLLVTIRTVVATTVSSHSAADVASAVWNTLTSALTTVGSVGKLIVDYLNAAITSRAPADEYDTEMARLDVAVSSRAAPGDAMDLVADAVDAAALKADAVAEIQSGLATAGEYDAALAAIQVDLDNPAQYKADVSALALEATLTAVKGAGWTTQTLVALKAVVDAILADTGTDGVVVASHTTAAKAEIQAEAEDALKAYDLDHLIKTSAGNEKPTVGSYLDRVMNKSASQTFNAATDSLEAIRDTLSSAEITVVSAVDGGTITVVPYTTWEFTIDRLADLSDALPNGVFFTAKEKETDADAVSILQVQEGVGLKYINGAAGTVSKATLTVAGSEDAITVRVNASVTGIAGVRELVWDIKKLVTSGEDADQVAKGTFVIAVQAVTKVLKTD